LTVPTHVTHFYCLADHQSSAEAVTALRSLPDLVVQEANLLLMDSVAGVGYSYSLNDSDYTTSDSQAQIDMEATLRTWFQMYPYFANHTVFLQGD